MVCRYCGAQIHTDDHRCGRCGRRVADEPVRRPSMPPVQQAATAPALTPVPVEHPAPAPGPQLVRDLPNAPPASSSPAQPSLFGPMEVVPGRSRRHEPVPQASARRRPGRAMQSNFDFSSAEGARTLPNSVAATVYCDADVALARDRMVAGAIDLIIPCCGFALFLTAAQLSGGAVALDVRSAPFMGAAVLLIGLFYRLVCCLGNMDTPGVRWAGLELLSFDGFRPTRRARLFRLGGGMVSTVAAGLGLLWSLLDQERLTWHDYMSGTFPARRRID